MTLGVGIIGAGVMGADHARVLAQSVGGARLVAVADADRDRAAQVASANDALRTHADGTALIADSDVDAVLVASPDATHAPLVLACLAAGKPVLCEKPLAPTAAECGAVIEAETRLGRRLVQVGFMRRFDPAYAAMRTSVAAGEIGTAMMLHCVHHNAKAPAFFEPGMIVTNAAVHEIDVARWLLGEEIARVTTFGANPDRMLLVMESASGVLIDVALYMNATYGYDVRAELVGSRASLSRAPADPATRRADAAQATALATDWRAHFEAAYRLQLQAWIRSIRTGAPAGASAWDGYAATAVAEACLRASASGRREPVDLPLAPPLYHQR
jgi:myo-inositol 2-dehydrogenase/D-chiro-inositol 1-dehydrogenase